MFEYQLLAVCYITPMENLRILTREIGALAEKTGLWIQKEQRSFQPELEEEKDHNSLVSYVDKKAEEQLVEGLSKLLPDAGFITEEATVLNERKALSWVIDPLDGTTNFIHGLSLFAVSIGLLDGDDLIAGVVYEAGQKELFSSWKGGGAWCNDERIAVSKRKTVKEGLFATGFPYYDYGRMQAFQALLSDFFVGSRGLRRLGSAATDLAWVACGRFEGFFEYGLSAWDVAGGALLVQEAGGSVCDFEGGDDFLFGKTIISANEHVFEEFRSIIQNRMSPVK